MFHYVIVGAGSAGCVLANRLSEDPAARVLLLEAGPPDRKLEIHVPAAWIKLLKTRYDWAYATEPDPALGGRSLYWPRGRTLGGTSSINYLRPARRRRNLTVVTGAHATRVVVQRGRVVGVDYVVGGRARRALAAAEVVLSGGAIASPQLLMLSGVGPAAHLRAHGIRVLADLPGVGRNLQDHVAAPMRVRINRPLSLSTAESPANLVRWLTRRTGMMSSNVIEAAAFTRTRPGLEAPDVELMFGPVLWIDPENIVMPTEHGVTVAPVVLQPRSRGAVELRSADPFQQPAIHVAALSDPGGEDLRALTEGVRIALRVLGTPPLRDQLAERPTPGPAEAEIGAFIRANAQTTWHATGTCSMGVDGRAVVDPELRVRGLDGLRVVDVSVMPVINRGHPNAPVIMLAEKAADLIRAGSPAAARAVARPTGPR